MQLDPTTIHVDRHGGSAEEESFQQLVHQSLQKSPWMALSLLVHAVAVMLIILLVPDSEPKTEPFQVAMAAQEPDPIVEPDPPEPPKPKDPKEADDDPLVDNPAPVDAEVPAEIPSDDPSPADNPTDWSMSPAVPGFGHGTPGYGGRRGGGGKRGRRPNRIIIERGLKWLRDHQDQNGRWDADGFMKHDKSGVPCDGPGNAVHDVGVTGLALLAFLGDGHTLRDGKYRDHVKRGIRWLIKQQQPNGLLGSNASHDFIYDHAIATIALCETMGLSRSSILKPYAQKAINYLEYHRNPYAVWRYQPQNHDNDASITGWAFMAYKSAKDFELQVSDRAFTTVGSWFDEMTDPSNGRCGYMKRGELSSRHQGDHGTRFPPEKGETLTAVGLMCRFFLGQDPKKQKVMTAAADTILSKPPVWLKDGSIDHYYWYYATYALYQMGGKHWNQWSKKLTASVVKTQREDGNFKGSWDPAGAWGEDGGRVYSTAILVLTLQAYYRYARVLVR